VTAEKKKNAPSPDDPTARPPRRDDPKHEHPSGARPHTERDDRDEEPDNPRVQQHRQPDQGKGSR
jgi:hypothetical protein